MITREHLRLIDRVEHAGKSLPREANIGINFGQKALQLDTVFQGAWNTVASKTLKPHQAMVVGVEPGTTHVQFGIRGEPETVAPLEAVLISRLLFDRNGVSLFQLRQEGIEEVFELGGLRQIDGAWRSIRSRTSRVTANPDAFAIKESVGMTTAYKINPLTIVTSLDSLRAARRQMNTQKGVPAAGSPITQEAQEPTQVTLQDPADKHLSDKYGCIKIDAIDSLQDYRALLMEFLNGETDTIFVVEGEGHALKSTSDVVLRRIIQETSLDQYGDRWRYLQRIYASVHAPEIDDMERGL